MGFFILYIIEKGIYMKYIKTFEKFASEEYDNVISNT